MSIFHPYPPSHPYHFSLHRYNFQLHSPAFYCWGCLHASRDCFATLNPLCNHCGMRGVLRAWKHLGAALNQGWPNTSVSWGSGISHFLATQEREFAIRCHRLASRLPSGIKLKLLSWECSLYTGPSLVSLFFYSYQYHLCLLSKLLTSRCLSLVLILK